ncbi:hypothetical protein RRG08_044046 [Elysia crispata]|uniref:Uncharacterized protein n=1 Tax=Elysia crispata TaxID=231223 RepID=A0AAE1CRG5_9GAST|nr:hypothetical protein RRG08_044046 [Elysia crispata]
MGNVHLTSCCGPTNGPDSPLVMTNIDTNRVIDQPVEIMRRNSAVDSCRRTPGPLSDARCCHGTILHGGRRGRSRKLSLIECRGVFFVRKLVSHMSRHVAKVALMSTCGCPHVTSLGQDGADVQLWLPTYHVSWLRWHR